jgi:hypothetical protein
VQVTAKHPIKIGSTLVAKGAVGSTAPMTKRIRDAFPGIQPNPNSSYVLVKFPGVLECLVSTAQLEWRVSPKVIGQPTKYAVGSAQWIGITELPIADLDLP